MENKHFHGNHSFRNNRENVATEIVAAVEESVVPAANKGFMGSAKSFVTSKWGIATIAALAVATVGGIICYNKKKSKPTEDDDTEETSGDNE